LTVIPHCDIYSAFGKRRNSVIKMMINFEQ
jgi:hypothetical protein